MDLLTKSIIQINSRDLDQMIVHCKRKSPIEACGILAGEKRIDNAIIIKKVLKVYQCRNTFNSAIEYGIASEEQLKIFSEMDNEGLELLGFYHSHPYTSSKPSLVDKEKANYVGYSYVIIVLNPVNVSSWLLKKKGMFEEEEILAI